MRGDLRIVNAPMLAMAYVRYAAPVGTSITFQALPDAVDKLPFIIVGTSAATPIDNGPILRAARFTLTISCYAADTESALQLANDTYVALHDAWQETYRTDYGSIAHVSRDGLLPQLVASGLQSDRVARFDASLNVTARF